MFDHPDVLVISKYMTQCFPPFMSRFIIFFTLVRTSDQWLWTLLQSPILRSYLRACLEQLGLLQRNIPHTNTQPFAHAYIHIWSILRKTLSERIELWFLNWLPMIQIIIICDKYRFQCFFNAIKYKNISTFIKIYEIFLNQS